MELPVVDSMKIVKNMQFVINSSIKLNDSN